MIRTTIFVLALASLAACSADAVTPPGDGRLLILDETGNVAVMAPDGSGVVTVTEDGGGAVTYFQPIWSPDGSRISATRSEAGTFSIEILNPDTGERASTATPSNSFYQYWSPDGTRLASLSVAAAGELGLDVLVVGGAAPPVRLATGQPLYFSWSPDTADVVAHIGATTLEILGADGTGPDFGAPGGFSSPQWTDEGITYVGIAGRRQQLMRTRDDEDPEIIASLFGGAVFSVANDGRSVAVLTAEGEGNGLSVLAQQAPILPAGRLLVVDAEGRSFIEVETGLVIMFSWDPTGKRLLILEGDAGRAFRWRVWEDGESRVFADFVPSPAFVRDVAPFFDQYAQSLTLWAPDGEAFAFPGAVDGVDGVWRQALDAEVPVYVAEGTWVVWSSG